MIINVMFILRIFGDVFWKQFVYKKGTLLEIRIKKI